MESSAYSVSSPRFIPSQMRNDPGVVAFNVSTGEVREEDLREFQASPVYTVDFRLARAAQLTPCLKRRDCGSDVRPA